jgi:hypothetical protein
MKSIYRHANWISLCSNVVQNQNCSNNFQWLPQAELWKILSRVSMWLQTGFWFDIRFTDHLHRRLVSTSNYSPTANLHSSHTITAPAKSFPACCVFTSRSLATVSNSWDSPASHSQVLYSQTPVQNRLVCPSPLVNGFFDHFTRRNYKLTLSLFPNYTVHSSTQSCVLSVLLDVSC